MPTTEDFLTIVNENKALKAEVERLEDTINHWREEQRTKVEAWGENPVDQRDEARASLAEAVGLLTEMGVLPDSTYWVYGAHRDQTDPSWIDRVRACVEKHK